MRDKQTILKSSLAVINIVFISMTGLVEDAHKSDSIIFAIVPLLICSAVLIFAKGYIPFANRKNIMWDVLFAGLFIVMLSAEDVLKTMRHMDHGMFYLIFMFLFFPLLFISVMIDVDHAFYVTSDAGTAPVDAAVAENKGAVERVSSGKFLGIYYPVWLFIAVTFVFVIAYYPGLMNSDFEKQWIWGEGPTAWSDWHTIGYIFFIKLCTSIIHKPFMVTIVQVLMYYLTANYAVGVLERRFPEYRRAGWIYICMYMCFAFYSCMYLSEIRKDNVSSPMLLAFAISLLDYVMSRHHMRREYINMGVTAFLASSFRHSLLEIVLATLVCIMCSEIFDKGAEGKVKKENIIRLGMVFVTTLVCFLVMTEGIGFRLLKAERNPAYVKYTIPMNLAASMAYRNRETGLYIDDDIAAKMEQVLPMEKWAEYYCPFDADTTDRPWHEIGDNVYKLNDPAVAADIIRVDWYYLTHYPKQCILSFFDVNAIVWEIAEAADLIMYSPGLATEHYEIHHMRKGEFFYFAESVKKFMGSFAIGRSAVYRGGLYLFLLLLTGVILLRKHQVRVFLAMLPILLYAAALMISIPQEGSHYIMVFPMFAALFGTVAYLIPGRMYKAE